MNDLPTLYYMHDGGDIDGIVRFVPVERCKHGLIDEHDSIVTKTDEKGRKFGAVEWCVGSPTLWVTDDE